MNLYRVVYPLAACVVFPLAGCSLDVSEGFSLTEQGPWDTTAQEIVQSNDTQFNSAQANGTVLNGLRFNGLRFNGLRFNGVSLDGTTFRGHRESDLSSVSGYDFEGTDVAAVMADNSELDVRIQRIQPTETSGLYFYEVEYNQGGTWRNICNTNQYAIPLADTWDANGRSVGDSNKFTFACRGAALAKCAEWGYKRWGIAQECDGPDCKYHSLRAFHQACTRMVRADYCGDGTPHTENGTMIDVWDALGLQTETANSGLALEAEWGPDGAVCVRHTRWADSATVDPAKQYILDHCPERWAGPDDLTCGSASSTFHTANGYDVPLDERSLLRNSSNHNLRF